jgi:hypothetical protein
MDVKKYYRSQTAQLESLKDRVWTFIGDAHRLTVGEWKEGVLRSILSPRLPETVRVGRGFVLTKQGPTTQCDILLYKASSPVLFTDGDLVILTPDAVLGIIEVKTTTDRTVLETALDKFSAIGRKMGRDKECMFALFSYESQLRNDQSVMNILQDKCDHPAAIVDLMNLGCSTFIKWWESDPEGTRVSYKKWHSYALDQMSAGYFLAMWSTP